MKRVSLSKNTGLLAKKNILLLITALLLLTACGKTPIIIPPSTGTPGHASVPPPTPVEQKKTSPNQLEEMRKAFNSGDYNQAVQVASDILQKTNTTTAEAQEAWKCLALSQTQLGLWTDTLDTLEKWKQADPAIESKWEWVNLWGNAVNHLPSQEAHDQAASLLYDNKREALARSRAAMILVTSSLPNESTSPILGLMRAIYQAMPTTDRAEMEKTFAQDLRTMNDIALQSLDASLLATFNGKNISEEQLCSYPYALIRIEAARRLSESSDPQTRASGTAELARLCASASLVTDKRQLPNLGNTPKDTTVLSNELPPVPTAVPAESLPFDGPANRSVALLLPMSGHYHTIANRIVKGAELAKKECVIYGITLNIIAIDSNQADWQSKLAALPKDVIIGGPLHPSAVDQLKTTKLTEGRAVFTFTTRLDPYEEGSTLWRFFPSLTDQVRALLTFANNDMGVTSVASLYPADTYGRRMTELFSSMAKKEFHWETSATEYVPTQHDQWNAIAARILGVKKANPPMRPRPSFQALFMPDSWLNAQTMVPHILFHQETRLILMGTSLWEQSLWEMTLQKKNVVDASAFTLAIFPGAWNPETTAPAGAHLQQTMIGETGQPADFWTALGYDFTRFAVRMGSPTNGPLEFIAGNANSWTREEVNKRLQEAADMQWAMAPIQWSTQGQASQDLYLFTPVSDGYQLTKPDEFRDVLEKTRQKFISRWGKS